MSEEDTVEEKAGAEKGKDVPRGRIMTTLGASGCQRCDGFDSPQVPEGPFDPPHPVQFPTPPISVRARNSRMSGSRGKVVQSRWDVWRYVDASPLESARLPQPDPASRPSCQTFGIRARPSAVLPVLRSMADLSAVRISANLRRWAGLGIDHKNPAHVSAYLLARQQFVRPRPEQVLAILGQSQVQTATTARLSTEFLLVPKGNLGGKAPGWLQDFLVGEEELRSNYRVPAHCDFAAVFVVDPSCPAERLGKRVARMAFEQSFSHSLSAEGSADAPPSPAGEDETESAVPPEPTPVPPTTESSPGTGSSSSGTVSVGPVDQANPGRAAEGPPSKKQRVLKMLISEEHHPVEEVEAQNLEDLIHRIKKAAKGKLLYSEDAANSATVHFWCKQAVLALQACGTSTPCGASFKQPVMVGIGCVGGRIGGGMVGFVSLCINREMCFTAYAPKHFWSGRVLGSRVAVISDVAAW